MYILISLENSKPAISYPDVLGTNAKLVGTAWKKIDGATKKVRTVKSLKILFKNYKLSVILIFTSFVPKKVKKIKMFSFTF